MATDLEGRVVRLEIILKAYQAQILKDEQRIQDLEQQVRSGEGGGPGASGNTTAVYIIDPVVISSNGNVTAQTIKAMVGGTLTTIRTDATVHNRMDVATVATANKRIIVAPNGDGTYTAVAQSC